MNKYCNESDGLRRMVSLCSCSAWDPTDSSTQLKIKNSLIRGMSMSGIYKTEEGQQRLMELYDRQLESLNVEYREQFVDTRFGKTHVLEVGNPEGQPLLYFHGGNSTAPYSLKQNLYLLKNYRVFAADTIGHPGKSDQRVLSSDNLEYGEWASDLIDAWV